MFFCAVLPPKGNTMCSSLTCTLPSALLPIHALGDQCWQGHEVQANIHQVASYITFPKDNRRKIAFLIP